MVITDDFTRKRNVTNVENVERLLRNVRIDHHYA